MQEKIRLNRFLAERLGWSRRQADERVERGDVRINGQTAQLGDRVSQTDCVEVKERNWHAVTQEVKYVYLAMNKPVGYVCSKRHQDTAPTIYELLPAQYQQLKTVGRLDKASSGLILLTNDGQFGFKMTHPKFAKHKLYEVKLDHALTPLHQQMIGEFGIELSDGHSRLILTRLDDERRYWRVEMSEGRNRQIRRTFGALGYSVVALERLEFGPYKLNSLKPGDWVELPRPEIG